MMMRLIPFVVFTLSTTACLIPVQGPKTGAVATGERVAVVDDVKTWVTTSKEKVAETEYTDENGAVVGKAAVYQDKETVHHAKIWYPVQGTEQLADEDFFKITGDQSALDQTLAMRQHGHKWRKIGVGTMVGGIVTLIVGIVVPNNVVREVVGTAGGAVIAGGYYMTWVGTSELNTDSHAVDRSVAAQDANNYNATLHGHPVGMSFGKSF